MKCVLILSNMLKITTSTVLRLASKSTLKEWLRGCSSLSDWLTVGFWLLTPGGSEVSTGLFSFPQSLSLQAKSLSYDYRPGWKSLSAIIKDAFIPLPQVLVGVCVCVPSNAFSLFACVHMVDVCVWKERSETEEGGINVCVCGWLQGGPVCGSG